MGWAETMLAGFKAAGIRLITYVPDHALVPLIDGAGRDEHFTIFTTTREDEAVGIACGAYLGGAPAVSLMQSSGFGNIPNALASLAVPYQIPVVLVISERGVLGEYNYVQVPISRVIAPTLDALGIPSYTLAREDEVEFVVARMTLQALRTQQPAAILLSPLLTGGKVDR